MSSFIYSSKLTTYRQNKNREEQELIALQLEAFLDLTSVSMLQDCEDCVV